MLFTSVDNPFIRKEYIKQITDLPEIEKFMQFPDEPGTPDELIARIGNAELITSDIFVNIDKYVLDRVPSLKAIFTQTVGYNYIDIEYAKQKGIKVYNCAGFNANAVAEFAFALITSLMRKIPMAQLHVRSGGWMYRYFEGRELQGKTIGIIGSGHVAQRLTQIAKGYGLNIIMTTKTPEKKKAGFLGINEFSSLDYLLVHSDIVVLSVPLNAETKHLIGKNELAKMKKEAIFVNVARQTIVDEYALAEAIINKQIAGAVLDLMITEPFNVKDYPMIIQEMINLPNVIVTPHIAGVSEEASATLGEVFVQNVKNFLKGDNTNCVNL